MPINDLLPLKAARRGAIANLKSFGPRDTCDLISISIHSHFAAPPYAASVLIIASVYVGWVDMNLLF